MPILALVFCLKNYLVNLKVETDLAVKDYSELVKKEHWRPLELQFRKVAQQIFRLWRQAKKVEEIYGRWT